jgi:glycosyltransferase involved in cell wall biosynthesis
MANSTENARVLTSYYRPKPGGFCRRLFLAIEALLAEGHTVHYLSVVPFPIAHPRCLHHRFPWPASRTDGPWFWVYFHVLAPFTLLFLALRHRITHAFAFGHTYAFLLQFARLARQLPLSVFLRADVMETHRLKGYPHWLIRLDGVIEAVALHKSRVYCVSSALAGRVRATHTHCRPLAVEVLRNALPEPGATVRARDSIVLPLRLASVGILEERKNQTLLLDTMAHLHPTMAQLYIYGSGRHEQALRDQARANGLEDRVRFNGWVDDLNEIWRHNDLLLFPSRHEGSPNAVLEALAAGVPVLASDIPEHREILPASSLLPLDDAKRWVQALREIAAEPSRLASLRERQDAAAAPLRFDWDKAVVTAILASDTRAVFTEDGRC